MNSIKRKLKKMAMKRRNTKQPTNKTAVTKKKKKRRRKKDPNATAVHYYDQLSQNDDEWMKFIDADEWIEQARIQNLTNTTTTLATYKFELNPAKASRDVWRRMNRTIPTTSGRTIYSKKWRTTKKWTTARKQEHVSNKIDRVRDTTPVDNTFEMLSEDAEYSEESRNKRLHEKRSKPERKPDKNRYSKFSDYTESGNTNEKENADQKYRSNSKHSGKREKVESKKETFEFTKPRDKELNNERKQRKNIRSSSEATHYDQNDTGDSEEKSISMKNNEKTKYLRKSGTRGKTTKEIKKTRKYEVEEKTSESIEKSTNARGGNEKRKRRFKRAITESDYESHESNSNDIEKSKQISSEFENQKIKSSIKPKSIKEINQKSSTLKFTQRRIDKNKKRRTISIMEAKERRLARKKSTTTQKRGLDPPIIAEHKKELKKLLTIPSSEIHNDELICDPNITTLYSVDEHNLEQLLGAINNTNNQKLFYDVIKDLEETGTVKQELQRDVEIEKMKKLLTTEESVTPTDETTIQESTTESPTTVTVRSPMVSTHIKTTVKQGTDKTKRIRVRTTLPIYVDGFSDEKTFTDTKQTKKELRPRLTTRKKSIHEILGITTPTPDSMEVLNSREKKEFFFDAYFEYGKRGPVKMDMIVSTTLKPKIRSTHLKIERKITINEEEIQKIKMKRKELDLKHLLGSQEDYYNEMKRIMDEKTIGKDTRENLMHEHLINKYGKEILERTDAPEKHTTVITKEDTTITTEKTTTKKEISTIAELEKSFEKATENKGSDYYFKAENPLFNIRMEAVDLKTTKNDDLENLVQEYNRQLLGEDDVTSKQHDRTAATHNTDDMSTMEHKSQYKKILQHYLVSNEKSSKDSISDFIKQLKTLNRTSITEKISVPTTKMEQGYSDEGTTSKHRITSQTTEETKPDSFSNRQTHESTTVNNLVKSSEYEEAIKNKFREEIMGNPNFVEEDLDSSKTSRENSDDKKTRIENAAERKFLADLDKIAEEDKDTSVTPFVSLSTKVVKKKRPKNETTLVPPVDSKDVENMMKNKDEHFEKVLGDFMKQHTEKTKPERLRGKSTKILSSTLPRSINEEWDTTRSHCPAFLNQTEFNAQCQKFIQIINKRGETQLQRLDFEMKTKNNNLGKLVSKNILTANNFAGVVKRKMKKPYDLTSEILYSVIPPHAIDSKATNKYRNLTGNTISKCGFFIDDKYPFLGALPDGLIQNEGVVKFINTSTYPNVNIRMLLLRDNKLRNNFIVGEKIELAPDGDLMYEIQGELHVSKRRYCDLFVYNGNDQLLLKVQRQKDFWKKNMRKPLIEFYRNHMMPVIVKRLLHRRYKVNAGDNYLLNSDEDLLSVIRGLRADTTHQTLPPRTTQPVTTPHVQQRDREQVHDSFAVKEEEEWENFDRKTVPIDLMGRTRSFKTIDKGDEKQAESKINKIKSKKYRDKGNREDSENSVESESRQADYTKGKKKFRSNSESKEKRKKYASLESLYNSQERIRHKSQSKTRNKISSIKREEKKNSEEYSSASTTERKRRMKHETREETYPSKTRNKISSKKREKKKNIEEYSSESATERKRKMKHKSSDDTSEDEKYRKRENVKKTKPKFKLQRKDTRKNIEGSKSKSVSKHVSSDSSNEISTENDQQSKSRKRPEKIFKAKKSVKKQKSSESEYSKKKKIVKRDLKNAEESRRQVNYIRGKRLKRDYLPDQVPDQDVSYGEMKKRGKNKDADHVTIENLYSYKDTEYCTSDYDPNESVFRSLPQRVEKVKQKPDFLVDFYKKGLIPKEEFLEIVRNKTKEGKPWRRIASVESSKTMETENYSDLVRVLKGEPLSGIKESATVDPVEYDKDDTCKKYMRNIGYGRPMDDTLFNKSIVFTADDIKRRKRERLEEKLARAKAKRTPTTKKCDCACRISTKKRKIKGTRKNRTLTIDDLSLGDDDVYDEVTKKKGRWKTTPGYDMYNASQRLHRRKWFRREYRKYWENLSKFKKLYPSEESENPDQKVSDRFYRLLKTERFNQKTWEEYTSVRECGHSYSEEYQNEREKRKQRLRLKYEHENTVEILKRLGKRLARKKQLLKNNGTRTPKHNTTSADLIDLVKKELVERKEMLKRKYSLLNNSTRKQFKRSIRERKIRSATQEIDSSSSLGNETSNEFEQESEGEALRRAEKGELDDHLEKTTVPLSCESYERFQQIKKIRARALKQRPKYANASPSSIELVLLKKELKKNGEDFSYLSVSITEEAQDNIQNHTIDSSELKPSDEERSGFYVTKPTRATMNDEEALMAILQDKSNEKKVLSTIKESNGKVIGNNQEPMPTSTVVGTKLEKSSSLSVKQTKKRGRPRKQTTTKEDQTKPTLETKVRGKRSVDQTRKKKMSRPLKKKSYSHSSSSSEESKSSREQSETTKKHKYKIKHRIQEPSKKFDRTVEIKSSVLKKKTNPRPREPSSSESDEDSKSSISTVKRKEDTKKRKQVRKQRKTEYESLSSKESISKRKSHRQRSSSDTEESSSSSQERKKYKDKRKRSKIIEKSDTSDSKSIFIKRKNTNPKKRHEKNRLSKRISPESRHKASSSDETSGESESSKSNEDGSFAGSKKHGKTKMTKDEIDDIRKEFRAKQRKLRRKRKKLRRKKLKRQNITITQITKVKTTSCKLYSTTMKPKKLDVLTPYTPSTIQIRFTKDRSKYKKLPTRDVESIFDHAEDKYEDFIKEYNLKHSCTPFSKRAIRKLQIIKEKEFNHKHGNKTGEEHKKGFDSYDSHNFDHNIPDRKHKPWEESAAKGSENTKKKIRRDSKYEEESRSERSKEKRKKKVRESKSSDDTEETSEEKSDYQKEKRRNDRNKMKKHKTRQENTDSISETDEKTREKMKEKRRKGTSSESHFPEKHKSSKKLVTSKTSSESQFHEKHKSSKTARVKTRERKERKIKPKSSEISHSEQTKPKVDSTKEREPTEPQVDSTKEQSNIKDTKKTSESKEETMYDPSAEKMYGFDELAEECRKTGDYSTFESSESASAVRRRFWKADRDREAGKPVDNSESSEKVSADAKQNKVAKAIDASHSSEKVSADAKQKKVAKAIDAYSHSSEKVSSDVKQSKVAKKVLKREKRTPEEEVTEANVINMDPLLATGGWTKRKKKKTTKFRRESTPWQSEEKRTTVHPLKRRVQKKMKLIERNRHDRVMLNTRNFTSVMEDRGLWHLMFSPGEEYTTPTHAIDREFHLPFTSYRVTDIDAYNAIAHKLVRDAAVPNKRKSQFRHSQRFFEMLLSTTPDPAHFNLATEMSRYWAEREELDMFIYRGKMQDLRNRLNTQHYLHRLRAPEGKKWRMLAWERTTPYSSTMRGGRLRRKGKKKLGVRE